MRRNSSNNTQGQGIVEYAILIGIVTVAILGMQLYAKRGIQAGIKMAADQMSPHANDPDGSKAQAEGMRYESGERRNQVFAAGSVLDRKVATRTMTNQAVTNDTILGGGVERTLVTQKTEVSGALGGGVSAVSEVVLDVSEP